MLVPALLVVASMVLRPQGLMGAHITCLEMMYTIQVIILLGNNALPHLDLLEHLLVRAVDDVDVEGATRCADDDVALQTLLSAYSPSAPR